MFIVMINSEKGGVGKTSLSHSLAFGAALREDPSFPIMMGHTDRREPLSYEHRGYDVIDMRDPAVGAEVIQRALETDQEGLLVVDTGANMLEYSSVLMRGVDMVIVPTEHDYDSIRMALDTYNRQPDKAFMVVNRAPSKHSSAYPRYKKRVLSKLPEDSLLFEFPAVRTISDFVQPEELDTYARSRLRAPSIQFWDAVKSVFV